MRGNAQASTAAPTGAPAVYAVDLDYFAAREWEVETGRDFDPEEIRRGEIVVLLGKTVAKNLFGEADPIDQVVRVRNVPFKVIGVMASKGQSAFGQDQDDAIFVPLDAGRRRVIGRNYAKERSVGSIFVKFGTEEDIAPGIDRITALLRQRHRLPGDQEDDFSIRNLTEIANTASASANTLSMLLAAVAAVSLLVGGIGIMNIMLVSVTERTREIGLRLAVGARPRDIRGQFLIEATTLATIGGALGVALGVGAAHAIARAAGWPSLVAAEAIVIAVAFSALVGIFFGFYPAQRAARLDPDRGAAAGVRISMRTTIDIDDALLAEAMEACGLKTKMATVEEALRRLVHEHRRKNAIADMAGLGWDGDLDALREGRLDQEVGR